MAVNILMKPIQNYNRDKLAEASNLAQVKSYILDLLTVLESDRRLLIATLRKIAGADFELGSTNAIVFGDPLTNGSWRIIRSGDNLITQRLEAGSWVTKQTITP